MSNTNSFKSAAELSSALETVDRLRRYITRVLVELNMREGACEAIDPACRALDSLEVLQMRIEVWETEALMGVKAESKVAS